MSKENTFHLKEDTNADAIKYNIIKMSCTQGAFILKLGLSESSVKLIKATLSWHAILLIGSSTAH